MLLKTQQQGIDTIWDRYEAQTPVCKFGKMGICCRICDIGPCRISLRDKGAKKGACGADASTICSRNLARQVAAGVAAHSDHGRDICHALLLTAQGKAEGYEIKDGKKLRVIAEEWNVDVENRTDPEMLALAKEKGAKGIVVAGICCTANEILMRQGAPVAGNFMHQELAIATGACDLMLVDVQCMMPALSDVVEHFHTKLVTTSAKAKMRNATHIQFSEDRGYSIAKEIMRLAIENYTNRGATDIPQVTEDLVAGFTAENIAQHLGGTYRPSYRPLNNGIMDGRLRGVVAVIGCNTPQKTQDKSHWDMVTELLKNDVLVVQTGCSAHASAKSGLLRPEAALKYAGQGLQDICDTVGIPPVLHLGSCVDNSRILVALCNMVDEGGIGKELCELPIAGAAPEAMCEKAIAIGFYCVASGAYVNYAPAMRVSGSPQVLKFLTEDVAELTGGRFDFEEDPVQAARNMIDHIDQKRKDLGLGPTMYAVPYEGKQDVSARRGGAGGCSEPVNAQSGAPPICPGSPGSTPTIND